MADNSQSSGGSGDIIATDELATINGAAATGGVKVQRAKVGYGADGDFNDVSATQGLPITSTPAENPLGLPTYDDAVASLIAGNSDSQDQRSLLDVLDPLSDNYVAPQAEAIGSQGRVLVQDPTSGGLLNVPVQRFFTGISAAVGTVLIGPQYCGDTPYFSLQFLSASGVTMAVEVLFPDGSWQPVWGQAAGITVGMYSSNAPTNSGGQNLCFVGNLSGAQYVRVRHTGTAATVRCTFSLLSTPPVGYIVTATTVSQSAAANLLCTNTPLVPTAATNLNSAATTNATSVKASAGRIFILSATNNGAAVCFLKLYNKASAPTVGTDVPVQVMSIPANGVPLTLEFGALGLQFSTGIAYAITNLIGDADTTAIAASQVKLMMSYV